MRQVLLLLRRPLWALLLASLALLPVTPGLAQGEEIVSTVNGDPISRVEFHARVQLVRWQYLKELSTLYELTGGNLALVAGHASRLVADLNDPLALAGAVLEEMETERLLWQAGEAQGLTPTAEDAEAREAAFFSLWTNVPVSELPANAEAQAFIADWYAGAAAASGLVRDDILILFATEALRARLYDFVAASVPAEEPAVRSRHILCSFHPGQTDNTAPPTDEERAAALQCIRAAQARLATGEPFADVAAALSDDRVSAARGGDLGWVLLSYLTEAYANAARDAALNTIVGPVETEYGLHLIEVLDRRVQALTAEQYQEAQQGYFKLWLDDLRAQATIIRADDWGADIPDTPDLSALDVTVQQAIAQLTAQ